MFCARIINMIVGIQGKKKKKKKKASLVEKVEKLQTRERCEYGSWSLCLSVSLCVSVSHSPVFVGPDHTCSCPSVVFERQSGA